MTKIDYSGRRLALLPIMLLVFALLLNSCGSKSDSAGDTGGASAQTAGSAQEGFVPIPLVLPPAVFSGTPQNYSVDNLEAPLGAPRPPFYAPVGTENVALGKPVTTGARFTIIGDIGQVTDGDKRGSEGSYVELQPFLQHVTIDLGEEHTVYAIVLWHFHSQARVYYDVIVQVADDPDFTTNVVTLFNNDIDNSAGFGVGEDMHYVETSEGKLIDAKGVRGRYVRLYSRGSTSNDLNHYTEVEVYGIPAAAI